MFKDLKVIFMGTPDFAMPTLKMLYAETNVILVVCQPDKEVGRKKELKAPITKEFALEKGIDIFQPIKIRSDFKLIEDLKPDLIVTAAYGQIVPKEVLNAARLGCLNIHGSLLPKYRGAAPIQWSILNGDKEAGITLMYMDEKMDTGDMIDKASINIETEDNVKTLYDKLSVLGADLLKNNLESIKNGTNNRVAQEETEASYARMLTREDELLDFNESVLKNFNKIRGMYPNAYTIINGDILKIISASYKKCDIKESNIICEVSKDILGISAADGIIYPKQVKPFGKKEMDIKSYLNGIDKNKLLKANVGI